MNDEQVARLLEVLTEIRDELRLVRSHVVPTTEPWELSTRLRAATKSMSDARLASRCLSVEEFDAALQAINKGL